MAKSTFSFLTWNYRVFVVYLQCRKLKIDMTQIEYIGLYSLWV